MKKIFCLVLAMLMVFTMVACNNTNPTDGSKPNTDGNAPDDFTAPSLGPVILEWENKEVADPTVEVSMQEITYTFNGTEIKDKIAISPLSYDKYKPQEIMAALMTVEHIKDWEFTFRTIESGAPYLTELGQQNSYMHTYSFEANETTDGQYTGNGLRVEFTLDTDSCYGYASISCDVYGNGLEQSQILDVLKVVYGESDAEFLCYDAMKAEGKYASYTVVKDFAIVAYSRDNSDGVKFNIACLNSATDVTNGYPGEYKPAVNTVPVFPELFGWQEAENNLLDMKHMGATFLAKHYGDGTYINIPHYGYIVEQVGEKTGTIFVMEGNIISGENKSTFSMQVIENSELIDGFMGLQVGYAAKNEVTQQTESDMRQQALAIAQEMIKDDFVDVMDGNKVYVVQYDEHEAYVLFKFEYVVDKDGNAAGYLSIGFTTVNPKGAEN